MIQIARENTPDRPVDPHAHSLRQTRFFDAFDVRSQRGLVPVTDLCNQVNIPRRTAYRWLAERHTHGEQVLRRRDWRTAKAQLRGTPGGGRPHKIPDAALAKLDHSAQASRRRRVSAQQIKLVYTLTSVRCSAR
jgi:hypothetical protein